MANIKYTKEQIEAMAKAYFGVERRSLNVEERAEMFKQFGVARRSFFRALKRFGLDAQYNYAK